MKNSTRAPWSLLALALVVGAAPLVASGARAQGPSAEAPEQTPPPTPPAGREADELHDARLRLQRYDLEGERTTAVIEALGHFVNRRSVDLTVDPEAASEVREANYLRAMATADLLILAHVRGLTATLERVAEAYGVAPGAVNAQVRHDLQTLARGIYAEQANDAARALAVLAGEASFGPDDRGARRDALFLGQAEAILAQEAPARLDALRALAAESATSDESATLAPDDRRLLAGLEAVFATLDRIDRRVRGGDPFSATVAEQSTRAREGFAGWTITASPSGETVLPRLTEVPGGADGVGEAQVLVFVATERQRAVLRWGWVPTITTDTHGVRIGAPGTPILPAVETLPLPSELPGFPGVLPELAQGLHDAIPRGTTVALGATPDTPGHILQRVMLSMRNAQIAPDALLGTRDGRIVSARIHEADDDAPDVVQSINIRLGGFSVVVRRGPTRDIDRVHGSDGWQPDWEGLERRVRPTRSTALRWMGGVDAATVIGTVFRSGRAQRAVLLILPGT